MNAVLNNRIFTAPLLWTAGEAEAITQGISTQSWVASGVTTDAHTLSPGDLYVHVDETDMSGLVKAYKRGAAAAIVLAVPVQLQGRMPFLLVENVMSALYDLAAVARLKCDPMRSIAIGGVLGKTTVKTFLNAAFSRQKVLHTKQDESLTPHLNIPLSLANLHPKTEIGLFEVNIERFGEAFAFGNQIKPSIVVMGKITQPNHDHFESLDDLVHETLGLFEAMPPNGTVILDADCPYYPTLMAEARTKGMKCVWGYGGSKHAHARFINATPEGDLTRVSFEILGERYSCTLRQGTRHAIDAMLASMLTIKACGLSIEKAMKSVGNVRALSKRGKEHHFNWHADAVTIIDETAHMSPLATETAIANFSKLKTVTKRRVLVLSDLPGLNAGSAEIQADLIDHARQWGIDCVIAVGQNFDDAAYDYSFNRVEDFIEAMPKLIQGNDHILLNGHKDSRFDKVIRAFKLHHYAHNKSVPEQVLVKKAINDMPTLLYALSGTANDL